MNNTNCVMMTGRMTKDTEVKYTQSGVAMGIFTIANNCYEPSAQDKKGVNFIDVKVFGKTAEAVMNFTGKGSLVAIVGELKQEKWTDNQGQNKSRIVIIANKVEFLTSKPQQGFQQQTQQGFQQAPQQGYKQAPRPVDNSFIADPWAESKPKNEAPVPNWNDEDIPF